MVVKSNVEDPRQRFRSPPRPAHDTIHARTDKPLT